MNEQMKHRRALMAALGASAVANPWPALAQPAGRFRRVGILPGGPMAPRQFQWDAFRKRMGELGYVEGKKVQYVIRAPEKEGGEYDTLAADLARQQVDAIVATAAVAIVAAKKATQRIPIVMCPSSDPVALGFVTSLRQPGGNITGVNIQAEETTGKRMQLLREMLPKVSSVAYLWQAIEGKPSAEGEAAEIAAAKLGMQLHKFPVTSAEALPAAFETAAKARVGAVLVGQSAFTFGLRSRFAALALQHRLPIVYSLPAAADAGYLMVYGPSDTEYYRQAALFVDKIFKGAKPADLPVEQPLKWELVINMKTAKALGITVPQVVLLQPARLIE